MPCQRSRNLKDSVEEEAVSEADVVEAAPSVEEVADSSVVEEADLAEEDVEEVVADLADSDKQKGY